MHEIFGIGPIINQKEKKKKNNKIDMSLKFGVLHASDVISFSVMLTYTVLHSPL